MINLIPALKASFKVDRLFLPKDAEVILQSRSDDDDSWDDILTMPASGVNGHWSIDERNIDWNNQQAQFLILSIIDDEAIRDRILKTEAVMFQSRRYKLTRLVEPLYGSEPVWQLKLEPFEWTT